MKKQRFLYRHCQHTFSAHTSEVAPHRFIANRVKHSLAGEASDKVSMTDLAKRHFVSPNCIQRLLQTLEMSRGNMCLMFTYHLCFDEFKSVKRVEGAMSFIYMDGTKRKMIDVLPDRRLDALRKHFSRYSFSGVYGRINVHNFAKQQTPIN